MKKALSVAIGFTSVMTPIFSSGVANANEIATFKDESKSALEEIVVTGEKTQRSLRNTASSTLVMTQERLDTMAGVISSNTLLNHIPNLVSVEPGNDAPAVRGVDGTGPASGANAFLAGSRPRLNYQLDGRTLGFNEALFQDSSLWDVQQVEVYRGPQSTLQGRNSIAGAIVIQTADPSFEWEGKIRAISGEQDKKVGSFAISGPLIDDVLAFRLAADYQARDTDVEFAGYQQSDDPGLYKNETYRGKLLFTPSDSIRSMLTLGHSDGRAPQSERVVRPFDDRIAQFPNQPTFRSRNTYGIWDTQWQVSDAVGIEVNVSATDFRTDRTALTGQGNMRIEGDETVFQPLLRMGSADDHISGFVGAYVFRTDQSEYIDLFGGGNFRDETDSDAVFGEATWRVGEKLSVTAGARYEEERRNRKGSTGPMSVDFKKTYKEFLPKATLAWQSSDDWTLGMSAARGYNGGGAGITFSPPFVAYTYDPEFVWSYEGFARGVLMDGKMSLTANVFYNEFDDMQLPFTLGVNSTVIRNAEKATTYGAEASVNYVFSPGNELFANIGLLKTQVDRYADPLVEGNELSRSPAFTVDLGFVASPFSRVEVSANARFSDTYYSEASNAPRGKVDAYTVVNAQIAYKLESMRLFVSAENLFDSDHEISILTGATAAADSATLIRPRSVSAGVEYSF